MQLFCLHLSQNWKLPNSSRNFLNCKILLNISYYQSFLYPLPSSVSADNVYVYQSPTHSPTTSPTNPPAAPQINYSVMGSTSSYEGSFTLETGDETSPVRETIPLRSLRSQHSNAGPLAKLESFESNTSSSQSRGSSDKNGATGTSFLR